MGGIRGLKAEEVKEYIRYIADRRLLQLSLKPNYGVKENPLSWLDWVLNGVEHANFFENRATEYNKGTVTGRSCGTNLTLLDEKRNGRFNIYLTNVDDLIKLLKQSVTLKSHLI